MRLRFCQSSYSDIKQGIFQPVHFVQRFLSGGAKIGVALAVEKNLEAGRHGLAGQPDGRQRLHEGLREAEAHPDWSVGGFFFLSP